MMVPDWFSPSEYTCDEYDDWDCFYEIVSCGTCGCEWENEYVYVKTVIEEDEDE